MSSSNLESDVFKGVQSQKVNTPCQVSEPGSNSISPLLGQGRGVFSKLFMLLISAIHLWGRSGRGHCRKMFRRISANSVEFLHFFLAQKAARLQISAISCKFLQNFAKLSTK